MKHQSLWQLNLSPFGLLFYTLYSATFKWWDFIQLSLIFITISEWFISFSNVFFQTQPKSDVFSYICTRSTFVLVRSLYYGPTFVRPTFVSPTFVSPTFVSPTFVSPTFVSPTFVRPTFVSPTCVLSDVRGSDVCTGSKGYG